MERYYTIKEPAQGELEVKRSRFIGYAKPVSSVEEAEAFVAEIKSRHWDARHNCSAYVLRNGRQHSSDDGEPQGTAGQPIRGVILGRDVTDCVIVVTRYFGGVLLGTGGLVRAYSQAASLALDAAGVVCMEPHQIGSLTCDYTLYGRLPSLIAELEGTVRDTDFTDKVSLQMALPTEAVPTFEQRLSDLSSGQCTVTWTGEEYLVK